MDELIDILEREGLCHQYSSPSLTELFFATHGHTQRYAAFYFCGGCRVMDTCKEYWLQFFSTGYDYGVWFGTTPRHRKGSYKKVKSCQCGPDSRWQCFIHEPPTGLTRRIEVERFIKRLTGRFVHGTVVQYPKFPPRRTSHASG